jgi:peptidoglycan-associated lipoprotein
MIKRLLCVVLGLGIVAGMTSCAAKKKNAVKTESIESISTQEPDIRSGEFTAITELSTIYFDYNKATIRTDTQAILKENAAYLKQNVGLELLIEGHCDDRGTLEYNMALSHRRASVVRDYLKKLGISAGRMSTIPYGEERPAVAGSSEEAWAKNRRAEFKIRHEAEK